MPIGVPVGIYTVNVDVTNAGTYSGYEYVTTTVNAPHTNGVGVNNGDNVTVTLTSQYAEQQEQNGYITINHTSSGLQNTTALPNGFNARYTIKDANGIVVENNAQPGVQYSVAPGEYTVHALVSYGAAPNGYYYNSGSSTETAQVTVASDNTSSNPAPANLVSVYQSNAGNTNVDTHLRFNQHTDHNAGFGSDYRRDNRTIPNGSTLVITIRVPEATHITTSVWGNGQNFASGTSFDYSEHYTEGNEDVYVYVLPNMQRLSNNDQSNGLYHGFHITGPNINGQNSYSYTCDVRLGTVTAQTGNGTYLASADKALSVAPVSDSFTRNPIVAYAEENEKDAPANSGNKLLNDIGVLLQSIQQRAQQAALFPLNPVVAYAKGNEKGAPADDEYPLLDDNGVLLQSVQQKAQQIALGKLPTGYTLDTAYGVAFDLSADSDWKHVFEQQPELDEYGNFFYYALVELEDLPDYSVSYTNNPVNAGLIRENMAAIADENNQNKPELLKLIASNSMKTGKLKLVKDITAGSDQDTQGPFYFKVTLTGADTSRLLLDGETISSSRISTEGDVTTIIVEFTGKQTHTLTGILLGTTYEVVELNTENNEGYTDYAMPEHWQQRGDVEITSDLDFGTYQKIEADETETAKITNEQTSDVSATKTWAPKNPGNITIYFKLYYQRTVTPDNGEPYTETTAVPNQPLRAISGSENENEITVSWPDLPVCMEDGTPYTYVVKEFIRNDEGEYLDPDTNLHYTEAAPDGYVKVENGLSITNTKSEEYNPKTNYTGTKRWVDTNKNVRPDSLHVTLMIDDHNPNTTDQRASYVENGETKYYEAQWTQGEGEMSDEWYYTFKNLPVFDSSGNTIDYYVVESEPGGYNQTSTTIKDKKYIRLTTKYIENIPLSGGSYTDYPLTLQYETDQPFVAMMENESTANRYDTDGHTYTFHVWTPRPLTDDEERLAVLKTINEDPNKRFPDNENATLQNTRFVTGQPTGDPSVAVDGYPDRHKVDFMYWEGNPVGQGYRVEIHQSGEKTFLLSFFGRRFFRNICFGYLNYSYTHGTTDLTNTQEFTTFNAEKTWGDNIMPPEDSVITFTLKASVNTANGTVEIANLEQTLGIPSANLQIVLNGTADYTQEQQGEDMQHVDGEPANPKAYENDAWHACWTDLPEFDSQGHQIHYGVTETYVIDGAPIDTSATGFPPVYTVDGHTASVSDTGLPPTATPGTAYVVTNQIPTTDIDVRKIWDIPEDHTVPADTHVTMTLKSTVDNENYSTIGSKELPNEKPAESELTDAEWLAGEAAWSCTWKNLPEYDETGHKITYTVEETGYTIDGVDYDPANPDAQPPDGYDWSFTNMLPTVGVEADKKWENSAGEDITNTIQHAKVTFLLQASTDGQNWSNVTEDALGNRVDPKEIEESPWKTYWENLPKYINGVRVQYQVKETVVLLQTDQGNGTNVTPEDPLVVEVTFPVVPTQNAGGDDPEPAGNDPGANGNDPEPVDPNIGTGVITNRLPATSVYAEKQWDSVTGVWPDPHISIKVKLAETNSQGQTVDSEFLQYTNPDPDLENGDKPYGFLTLSADNVSDVWENLPKYTDGGAYINYTIVETDMFYTPEGNDATPIPIANFRQYFDVREYLSVNGTNSITLVADNRQETEIEVTKEWLLEGEPRTDKTSIAFKLYSKVGQDGTPHQLFSVYKSVGEQSPTPTEVTNENPLTVNYDSDTGEWEVVKISRLPQYQLAYDSNTHTVSYVPIYYYVEETGVPAPTVITYGSVPASDDSGDQTGGDQTGGDQTGGDQTGGDQTGDDQSGSDAQPENFVSDPTAAAVNGGAITIRNSDSYVDITVKKVDAVTMDSQTPAPLQGATFQIFKKNSGGIYQPYNTTTNQILVTDEDPDTTKATSDTNGELHFNNLPDGYYRLDEIQPPTGYIKTGNETVYFYIENGVVVWTDASGSEIQTGHEPPQVAYDDANFLFTVGNISGAALPYTGGPGTNIFYLIGCILTMLAGAGIVMKRRRGEAA